MLSTYHADTCRSTWKKSLLWSSTSNIHRLIDTHICSNTLTHIPWVSEISLHSPLSKPWKTAEVKATVDQSLPGYFTLKLIIQHIKRCCRIDMTDGTGIFKRYIKTTSNHNRRGKLANAVTHLSASGRWGVILTSGVVLKDLKLRDRIWNKVAPHWLTHKRLSARPLRQLGIRHTHSAIMQLIKSYTWRVRRFDPACTWGL